MEYRERSCELWKQASQVKVLSGVVSKLQEGKDYYFRVKALNENGLGEARELLQAITAKDEVCFRYSFVTLTSCFLWSFNALKRSCVNPLVHCNRQKLSEAHVFSMHFTKK